MTTSQQIITIALVVLGTVLTRALPFIIFPEGRKPPKFISYLGTVLPYAVIAKAPPVRMMPSFVSVLASGIRT